MDMEKEYSDFLQTLGIEDVLIHEFIYSEENRGLFEISLRESENLRQLMEYNVFKRNISPLNILIRMVCSYIQLFGYDEIVQVIPEDTIFSRTCFTKTEDSRQRTNCYTEFNKSTTFSNLTTLGNLMIQNPRTINNSTIFFKAKTELRFLNLNKLSELIGISIKKGAPEKGNPMGRGLIAACCKKANMEELCSLFNCHGVIQCDVADVYYFYNEHDEDEVIPEPLKNNIQLRLYADRLVLQDIIEKRAYPVTNDLGYCGINIPGTGALYPEFNFHLKKGGEMEDSFIHPNGLQDIIEYVRPSMINDYIPVESDPYWLEAKGYDLNELLSEDNIRLYLNFNRSEFPFILSPNPDISYIWPEFTVTDENDNLVSLRAHPILILRSISIMAVYGYENNYNQIPYTFPYTTFDEIAHNIELQRQYIEILNSPEELPACGLLGEIVTSQEALSQEAIRQQALMYAGKKRKTIKKKKNHKHKKSKKNQKKKGRNNKKK